MSTELVSVHALAGTRSEIALKRIGRPLGVERCRRGHLGIHEAPHVCRARLNRGSKEAPAPGLSDDSCYSVARTRTR